MKRTAILTLSVSVIFALSLYGNDTAGDTQGDTNTVKTETKNITYPRDEPFQVLPDQVIQGVKYAKVTGPDEMEAWYYSKKAAWKLKQDISGLPEFSAPGFPILAALYRMALEEAKLDILPKENAFMAGKQWTGIWTRDVSYSISLSLGMLMPDISINTLKAKVNGTPAVIQDTGTGGSWPISSDRVVWAIAAWEVYLATGSADFLKYAYGVLKNTALADMATAYDASTGLYFGESSFMDWREQSYPVWMQPADIFQGRSLSTCVLHQRLYALLAEMGGILKADKKETAIWKDRAETVKTAINKYFWIAAKNCYGSYLYPSVMGSPLSDKSDNLGEALAVLFDIPGKDRSKTLVECIPVVYFGVPCFAPQQPHAKPYHNKAVWPFVEAFYALAGAKTGNEEAFSHAYLSMIRAAALFLTHKENFSYDKGHATDTEINSDRQLWSVAGYLGVVYRGLFGLNPARDGLAIRPIVPAFIKGPLVLSNFTYRNAKLNVTVKGNGSVIKTITVNGKKQKEGFIIPADTAGIVNVDIELASGGKTGKVNLVSINDIAPGEVQAALALDKDGKVTLTWKPVKNAANYLVFKNGVKTGETTNTSFEDALNPKETDKTAVYSVQAVGTNGIPSNLGAYLIAAPDAMKLTVEAEDAAYNTNNFANKNTGFSGTGYVKTVSDSNENISFSVDVPESGAYLVRFRYANGNGPINTDNKCCIRTLAVDTVKAGTMVFPQRGKWQDWGYSSAVTVSLAKGKHTVALFYRQYDENMNKKVNYAFIDCLELIRLK